MTSKPPTKFGYTNHDTLPIFSAPPNILKHTASNVAVQPTKTSRLSSRGDKGQITTAAKKSKIPTHCTVSTQCECSPLPYLTNDQTIRQTNQKTLHPIGRSPLTLPIKST